MTIKPLKKQCIIENSVHVGNKWCTYLPNQRNPKSQECVKLFVQV